MSHTNSTPNYQLPQFLGTDVPGWLTDVNESYQTIDTAMKGISDNADDAVATANSAVETAGTASAVANQLANTTVPNLATRITDLGTLSTTEKAVGIDYDGKTIYRKLFIGEETSFSVTGQFNTFFTKNIGNTAGLNIIDIKGILYTTSNNGAIFTSPLGRVYADGQRAIGGVNFVIASSSDNELKLSFYDVGSSVTKVKYRVEIEYTKG